MPRVIAFLLLLALAAPVEAAWNKRWAGTSSGDYSNAANWDAISVRTAAYSWTVSGSGTNEFYLRTAGGANPGLTATPGSVQINGVNATSGTLGALPAGQWAYGDNDTLGYSTLYVRLSDGADPDSKALNFVTFRQIPVAGDHVRIPAGTAAISSGLDQSAVAIGDFIVEDGYAQTIASSSAPLRIDPDRFEFSGGGTSYIDVQAANIDAQVFKTASAGTGAQGLYLQGSNLAKLIVHAGIVGVAVRHGETSTVATVRSTGAGQVTLGSGVTIGTKVYVSAGAVISRCSATIPDVTLEGGTLRTEEAGAITALTIDKGTAVCNSTGTITTANLTGSSSVLDLSQSGASRTVSTINHSLGRLRYDKNVVTVTTYNPPAAAVGPVDLTVSAP
jgi:hypothetical protein